MAHPDLERVLDLVRERTGYPVSVVSDPSLPFLSTMRAASASVPGHVVVLNPKHEALADYLVALQCSMLLVKWGRGGEVPDFVSSPSRTAFVEKKLVSQMKGLGLPEAQLAAHARMLVGGLLRQLASVAPSILAADWCRAECPGLRKEQEAAVSTELREASAALNPDVRDRVPPELFDRSVAMSAAYALWWSEASSSAAAVLPYRATGFEERGARLLAALRAVPADAPDRYQRAVDAWAEILGMVGWYEWKLRKG